MGLHADAWQEELLRKRPQRALLCCCRQAGKSTTAAAAAVHEALYSPGSTVLMLAPSQRQSSELLRKVRPFLYQVDGATSTRLNAESSILLELRNGSRIISLPAREDTIRGYSSVALLILDEAAWVADELYQAVRPMLAVSQGRLMALSTPHGQRGWFYSAWSGSGEWHRTKVPASECARIPAEFLADERRAMSASFFASEYECEFTDAVDSVFYGHDIKAAIDPTLTPLYPGGW